jgi:hypothetical protein
MKGLPGNRMPLREPYDVSPPETTHRADRAKRFIARVDAHLPTLSDDGRAAPSSSASSRDGSTATPASSQPKAPRSSQLILAIHRTPPTFCSPSPRSRRGASRLAGTLRRGGLGTIALFKGVHARVGRGGGRDALPMQLPHCDRGACRICLTHLTRIFEKSLYSESMR